MTDNEIIKALKCCRSENGDDCKNCPYSEVVYEHGKGGCTNRLMQDALDLIERQKAEIERLKLESVQSQNTRINELELKLLSSEGLCNKQEREIEQLRENIVANNRELDRWSEIVCEKNEEINILYKDALDEIKTAKSEAIKEFAGRLKTYKMQPFNYDRYLVPLVAIDEVVKEMTGRNDFKE